MIIRNGYVQNLRTGVTRYVQVDDEQALQVHIVDFAGTIQKVVYDTPPQGVTTPYRRGDQLLMVSGVGQPVLPVGNPYYVWRVLGPFWPLPALEISLVRLDVYTQSALLCSLITDQTPGQQPASDYDVIRHQTLVDTGPSLGGGRQVGTHQGYLASVPIVLSLLDTERKTVQSPQGRSTYEEARFFVEPPVVLSKGDVLILGTVRYVVGDTQQRIMVNDVAIGTLVLAEQRMPGTSIYSVPL